MSVSEVSSVTPKSASNSVSNGLKAHEISDRFMKLLVAQLKNQDPLTPMDSMSMTGQLSQLSSLSELTRIGDLLKESLQGNTSLSTELSSASNLVGKMVYAGIGVNEEIPVVDGNISFEIDEAIKDFNASRFELNVYDISGSKIKTVDVSSSTKEINLEGLPSNIKVEMIGYDSSGKVIGAVDTSTILKVGFEVKSAGLKNGVVYLTSESGQRLPFNNVISISSGGSKDKPQSV